MNKKVTVLVAIYNGGEFISSKINNLLQQTILDDIHIVFLNCQNFNNERAQYENLLDCKKVSCHEILYHKHFGLYYTWNDGIKTSDSEFICNANIDDMWHPQYLEKCVNHLNNSDCAVVNSVILITKTPNQYDHSKWSNIIGVIPSHPYPLSTAGPCPVWRRSVHDKYGYFGDYLTIGDARMWEKWHDGNEKFDVIKEELTLYYAHPCSLERRIDHSTGKSFRDIDIDKRL